MLNAIHKKTGKRIEAHKLRLDASWVGCKSDEWIAPSPEVSNWEELKARNIFEVKVSYIKNHKSQRDGNFYEVRDHFRIITEGAKDRSENESEEHKLAKEGIYYNIIDNKIDLVWGNNKVKPESLGSFGLEIEERLSQNKCAKIGDVVMTFETPHEILGKGIVFEIQLSNQTEEKTLERTYDRVKQGYSVVWMWDGMFCLNKLINPELEVIPFRTALDEYDVLKIEEVNTIGRVIDNKILDLERNYDEQILKMEGEQQIKQANATAEFYACLIKGQEGFQKRYDEFLKMKEEGIYETLLKNLTSKIFIDEGKIKELVQEEIKNTTERMLKDSEEIKVIETTVNENISNAVDKYRSKIKEEVNSKIQKESDKIITSHEYEKCLKERFGMDLASFARTYLNAKIYDLKKVMEDEKD